MASGVVPECGPIEAIEAAYRGGFDAVGLWVEPDEWTTGTTREVLSLLKNLAFPVLDVEVVWIKPGAFDSDHLKIIDIGAAVGARNVLVVSSDPDMHETTEKFFRLCEHGSECGLRVCLEFGMFTEVKRLEQAIKILNDVKHPAAAILPDSIHLSRSGAHPSDLLQLDQHYIPYAQICDAPTTWKADADVAEYIREAVDDRMQLGEGGLPLRDFVSVLPKNTPLSVELRSKTLREMYPNAVERARQVATATRKFLAG
jgi:sugar phosphate isomerase/epimerase